MTNPLICAAAADFRMAPKDALRRTAELGFSGVEVATVAGELAPASLTPSGRRHLRRYVDSFGLQFVSLNADIPGLRLTDPRSVSERVERTCQVLDLGREMQVPIVTASVGALTHPESGDPSPLAMQALRRIGEFADSRGMQFALRPTNDDADRMLRILDTLRCPSLSIGLDPAAMIMAGANPLALVERLANQVVLVHARDGTAGTSERGGGETALGEGDVDWTGLMQRLFEADFNRNFVVRRLDTKDPLAEIQAARERLASWLTRP